MPRKLGDAAFQRIFRALVSDARAYRDGQLAPARIRGWQYYKGLVDAQPRRNRSRAVSTDVRDTVEAVHSQLMKLFGASGHIVSYEATSSQSQRQAEIATDYMHHVFLRENRGWTVLSDFFRDGLVADVGVLHHRAEEEHSVNEEEYHSLTPSEADALSQSPDVDVLERRDDSLVPEPAPPSDDEDEDAASTPPQGPTFPTAQTPSGPGLDNVPAGPQQYPGPGGPAGPVGPVSGGTGAIQPGLPQPISTPFPGPAGAMPGTPMAPSIYLRLSRRVSRTVIKVDAVPPDEFLVDPAAIEPAQAKLMAIDCTRSVGDLTAAGYAYKTVLAHAGTDKSLTAERLARIPYTVRQRDTTITDDPTTYPLTLIQANVRVDTDGDGVPEIWRVTALGEDFTVIDRERTDVWEFTVGSPYNVPHSIVGTGVARLVTDLQDIQTAILRTQLDSLYQAVNPKYTAVEGQVNLDDATDESFARVVRIRSQGAFAPMSIPFVGEQAFPMIERLDKIREFRTGVSPEAAGLDADALQSSTEVGVRAIVGQALLRIETIARNYAENAITDLFRALLKLAVRYQDRSVSFKAANGYLTVDPSGFDPDLSVIPVVGLGNDNDQVKLGTLNIVKQTQEQIFQTLGPGNPLVGLGEYRNTLVDMLNLSPYRNSNRYFKALPPNVDQMMAQQAQQQQQQNPMAAAAQAQAQARTMQAQAQVAAIQQKTQAQMQTEGMKAQAEQQRDQRKQAFEEQLAMMQMQLDRMKAEQQMMLEQRKARNEMTLDVAQMGMDAQLERVKLAHQMATNAVVPNPATRQ